MRIKKKTEKGSFQLDKDKKTVGNLKNHELM